MHGTFYPTSSQGELRCSDIGSTAAICRKVSLPAEKCLAPYWYWYTTHAAIVRCTHNALRLPPLSLVASLPMERATARTRKRFVRDECSNMDAHYLQIKRVVVFFCKAVGVVVLKGQNSRSLRNDEYGC